MLTCGLSVGSKNGYVETSEVGTASVLAKMEL
jgi:hypothetical protein